MEKFICTSKARDAFDVNGNYIGVVNKRGLFYSSRIGRSRIYRDDFEKPAKGMKIKKFSKKESAIHACNKINDAYNDDFVVETISK